MTTPVNIMSDDEIVNKVVDACLRHCPDPVYLQHLASMCPMIQDDFMRDWSQKQLANVMETAA